MLESTKMCTSAYKKVGKHKKSAHMHMINVGKHKNVHICLREMLESTKMCTFAYDKCCKAQKCAHVPTRNVGKHKNVHMCP